MKNQSLWKRWAFTALGSFVFGIGIGICDLAMLGTDPFTVLLVGLVKQFGFTIGIMNTAVSLLMILFTFCTERSMVSPVTFAAMFAASAGIDAVRLPGITVQEMWARILLLGVGVFLYAFGCAAAIVPEAGYDAYNGFLISLQKLTSHSYRRVRWTVEIVFLVGGRLLGGVIGIGTLACFGFVGPLVELFRIPLAKRLRPLFEEKA